VTGEIHPVVMRHWQPRRKEPKAQQETPGPVLYDTAFSPEDGNGIQQGWGGRRQ